MQTAATHELQSEEGYRRIKTDVIRCALPPGTEITEGELCERYTLGKASVRMALARLGQEGLLKALPRRGHVIAPITLADVSDVFDLRLILEPAGIRLVTERATDQAIATLVELGQSKPQLPNGADYVSSNLDANHRFHVGIAIATGNDRLVRSTMQLLEAVERVLHLWISTRVSVDQTLETEYGEHAEIARAIQNRQPDLAAELLEEHLVGARDEILALLMGNRSALSLQVGRPG
jgi:DNA-binding GntR family transcriptional regulator